MRHSDPGEPESGVHHLTCRWVCETVRKTQDGELPWDTKCVEDHHCWCDPDDYVDGTAMYGNHAIV